MLYYTLKVELYCDSLDCTKYATITCSRLTIKANPLKEIHKLIKSAGWLCLPALPSSGIEDRWLCPGCADKKAREEKK